MEPSCQSTTAATREQNSAEKTPSGLERRKRGKLYQKAGSPPSRRSHRRLSSRGGNNSMKRRSSQLFQK